MCFYERDEFFGDSFRQDGARLVLGPDGLDHCVCECGLECMRPVLNFLSYFENWKIFSMGLRFQWDWKIFSMGLKILNGIENSSMGLKILNGIEIPMGLENILQWD